MTRRIFALVGDTHCDSANRFEEHNAIMSHIAWDAKGRGAQALLHSGDVYERSSNSREREAVARWVMNAAGLMQVVVIRGNHDDPRDIAALGHLRTQFPVHADTRPGPLIPVHAYTVNGTYTPDVLAWIAVLPWPEKTYLLAGAEQKSRAQGDADAVTALRNILRDYGQRFAGLQNDTEPRIFLGHCMVRGSSVGISQPPLVGADFELGLDDLALVGADLYALGHIHLGQDWVVENHQQHSVRPEPPVIYPGSPSRKNFGEIEDKSYVLATFEDRTLVSWERIPTPCRKMLHVTGSFGIVDGQGECMLDAPLPDAGGAEVRLRYEVRPEERAAARVAAQGMAALLRADGAANVVLEEVVKVEQRARAPEVAAAATNAERLRLHWASKNSDCLGRQHELLGKLAELETSLEQSSVSPKLGAIRFKRLRIQGFGPFEQPRDVRLDALDGRITAVTGANGAGKSTLLECLLGGIYRKCPTRGSLVDLAVQRDACLEVDFDAGGHAYYVKQLVDAVSRKSEAVITKDGSPQTRSTKVSSVQEYVDKHLPSLPLQLVSTFAAQKSGGFLDTKPADRKALLLQIRGVEQLQELAGLARMRASAETIEIGKLDARIGDRHGDAQKLAETRADAENEQLALQTDEALLSTAEHEVELAKAYNADAVRRGEERARIESALRALEAQHSAGELSLRGVQERMEKARSVLQRKEAIRRAAAAQQDLVLERGGLSREQTFGESAGARLRSERSRLSQAQLDAARRQRENATVLGLKPAIEDAIQKLPLAQAALTQARADYAERRKRVHELQGTALLDADGRIKALRTVLVDLRDGPPMLVDDVCDIARGALDADDAAERALSDVPKRISDAMGEMGSAERQGRRLQESVQLLEHTASKAPFVKDAEQAHADASAEATRIQQELSESDTALQDNIKAAAVRATRLAEIDRELTRLAPDAREAPNLDRAEAALEELRPQESELKRKLNALHLEMSGLGAVPAVPTERALAPLTAEVQRCGQLLELHRRALVRASQLIEQLEASRAAVTELLGERGRRFIEHSDWERLAIDLGKDGLQAALSDAALPELVALCNTLLHSAFGPRFTVDVRSQKGAADGKRLLETLDVWVIDTGDVARGIPAREAIAETFSGGELAIIGEALSLALTVLACRSSDGTPPTLVRDEAGAALDPVNGRAWMAMLRRAVEMVGADRLLFVSHSPEITALADSRIEL